MYDHGQYLDSLEEPAASRIEDLGSDGPPTVLFDGRSEIKSLIDELNEETNELEGNTTKGCSTTGGAGLAGLFLVLPTILIGRRR
ncbi:hypothetical protein IDX04_34655 [Pseudomonas aeruginosa]|nr:hypothetical protein [Pseudomonas aeruginosa]